ncbi:sulfatase-like hydrolase/transferase [Streptomyces sp. NBRC 110035]|uniref:sulfatase-like hydrolase/transferase n=1 Tax=unclassified Streptomyces TaxID=2593676 RepID=UPI0005A67AF1|nr:sulfatase-like hydrolase/transferase [Streptomyces sp. NBRC 110035]
MHEPSHYDHVVLVSVDTLRSDALSAHPNPLWPHTYRDVRRVDTTVLDTLASRGAYFPNMISAAPYTAASHGAIFTGQYPLHNGLHEFYNGSLKAPSVFTYGRRDGRRTVMKVDFPIILGKELGFTRDIDTYLIEDDEGFIEAVASADRTVALAHFGSVHVPYGFHNLTLGGDAYREKVAELEAGLPDELPFVDRLVETYRDPEDADLLMRYKRVTTYLHQQGAYDRLFQLYLDGVEHFLATRLSAFLDRLTERVAATGKRMLLVLFADHGEEFDEQTNGHFNSMAEGVLRVPLIIVGDGVEPGTHERRIRTVDIAPTVLELAGVPAPATGVFDGRSLASVARGEEVLGGDAPAVAESYNVELNDFIAFQERQLSGRTPGPLPHFLVGHAAYLGDRRVVRMARHYSEALQRATPYDRVRVERFDADGVPRPVPDDDGADLLAMLDDYRTALRESEQTTVTDEMRGQLRSLGYSV